MIQPFSGSTLLDICISKLLNSSIIPKQNIYLSCNDKEIESIGLKYNINIYKRSKASAQEESDMRSIFEWHKELALKYKYVILISACNPLLKAETIDSFVRLFLSSKQQGAFSVFKKNNYLWDKDGKPTTDWKGFQVMNTKIVDPYYEGAHCLYASPLNLIKRNMFMDDSYPPKPFLFIVDEIEAFDIDYPWQFEVGEVLYKNNFISSEHPLKTNKRVLQFLFESKKLLIVGPAIDSSFNLSFFENKREEGYTILSFSSASLIFFKDIGFCPDFHTFTDPHSYCYALDRVGKSFLSNINFLGYEVLDFPSLTETNKKLFGRSNFGITDFLSNFNYTSIYKKQPPISCYKNCFSQNPNSIEPFSSSKDIDFKKQLFRFTNGHSEIEKLTYFLLPLCLFWFKNLESLDLFGFGFFSQSRYMGGDNRSYSAYMHAFDKILPLYNRIKFSPTINLDIKKESYFQPLKQSLQNK